MKLRTVAALLGPVFSAQGIDEVIIRQDVPLPELPVAASDGGALETSISLSSARLVGAGLDVTTRIYNGSVPGPVLAVSPGDKLSIRLENFLEQPKGPSAVNMYHHPNTTNLHVHGLHVSPYAPSDDVLGTHVPPQRSNTYSYTIIPEHTPGTYWYHPHHHGSVLLQAGAGAAGALLVRDPPGFLPAEVADVPEKTIVLQHLSKSKLEGGAKAAADHLFKVAQWDRADTVLLVNGAIEPYLTAKPNTWQRLRFIMAGVSNWIIFDFGKCEANLLAKDGVYISDFPRAVNRATLPPGGRMDVLLRCPPAADNEGEALYDIIGAHPPPAGKATGPWQGVIMRVRVSGHAQPVQLQAWAPARPAYLRDAFQESVQPECACETVMGRTHAGKLMVNDVPYHDSTSFIAYSPSNAVVERHLVNTHQHIYHQHTYPFQIGDVPAEDPYFRKGDWHDSYINVWAPNVTIRFNTMDYSGPMIVHCHDLTHSDRGMMGVEFVGGENLRGTCNCHPTAEENAELATLLAVGLQRFGLSFSSTLLVSLVSCFLCLAAACFGVLRFATSRSRKCCGKDFQQLPGGPEEE
eukprot:TRINITY_DN22913_c0_g1_i1.p1 TRINITY_DN22913_c0_g1~~TRINITY_DN22913_c0_g1_i1.p1  ORF type:complete len:577 (-),score=91.40 TRINITY_DN22913_c0_g1_i1:343-2073(-)